MAQDSRFYLSTELATAFGERLARGAGQVFVTNLVNNAASAFTSASAASLTADEVIDLTCSVDEKYSARGAFLMRLSTYQAISKLKGSTSGDWLFPPGGRDALGRRTLAGYPVFTSPSMPPLQANARAVIFGDLSRFRIRQIENGIAVQTLVERYAEYGAIAYMLFARLDGALLKGADYGSPVVSGSPCKYILQHS